MSNNKQSSVEMMWDKIDNLISYKDSATGHKFCALLGKYKAMHKEESINLTKHWYNQWEQGKGMTISEYYDQEFNNK